MILIVGKTTRYDTDWVPFEIQYAVDICGMPIIAVYPGYEYILLPRDRAPLWPNALQQRINDSSARVIHIPFKQAPLAEAVGQFNYDNLPKGPLSYYTRDVYKSWGIIK